MAETLPLQLVYEGPDVDNGTMTVSDMIDVLAGFSGAYSKLAGRQRDAVEHRIRIIGLEKGSARIMLDVVEWVKQNPGAGAVLVSGAGVALTGIGMVAAGAYKIITDIGRVIGGKKHLAGADPAAAKIQISGPTVVLLNETKQPYEMTKEQFEVLKSGILDPDLDRITAPLVESRVNNFQMRAADQVFGEVSARERIYFEYSERTVTVTRDEIWIEGVLNSLSKTGYRGTFHTSSGKHVTYKYLGEDPTPLLNAFAYKGTVRVRCKAQLNEALDPVALQIYEVQIVQASFEDNFTPFIPDIDLN